MNFVFAKKKKKTQITITEGNEDMLHKSLQNVCVAFTDSSTAADFHNRRINNSYFVSSHFRHLSRLLWNQL